MGKTFETYEEVAGMSNCMKRPVVIQAKQMAEDFRVQSLEGDFAQGKAGDYLMRGVKGELYICAKDIFEQSYDFVN